MNWIMGIYFGLHMGFVCYMFFKINRKVTENTLCIINQLEINDKIMEFIEIMNERK